MRAPIYIETFASGQLASKVAQGLEALSRCRLCPRDCDIDRLKNEYATCLSGRQAVLSSAYPHFGEEDCLRGYAGSGTLFFGHCNLKCVFCQNFSFSQRSSVDDPGVSAETLAGRMLDLQAKGCHNINFVTAEHVVPQILEALLVAIPKGLKIPLVYNTSGYDSAESLELLDGVIDIYMPDFKLWSSEKSQRWLKAKDYPETVRATIRKMHRQVGPLVVGRDGLARRGLLVRHLVMPDSLDDTRQILRFLAQEISPDTYVNLMDQYHPAGKVGSTKYPELDRPTSSKEMRMARDIAAEEGIWRLDRRRPHPWLLSQLSQQVASK